MVACKPSARIVVMPSAKFADPTHSIAHTNPPKRREHPKTVRRCRRCPSALPPIDRPLETKSTFQYSLSHQSFRNRHAIPLSAGTHSLGHLVMFELIALVTDEICSPSSSCFSFASVSTHVRGPIPETHSLDWRNNISLSLRTSNDVITPSALSCLALISISCRITLPPCSTTTL